MELQISGAEHTLCSCLFVPLSTSGFKLEDPLLLISCLIPFMVRAPGLFLNGVMVLESYKQSFEAKGLLSLWTSVFLSDCSRRIVRV